MERPAELSGAAPAIKVRRMFYKRCMALGEPQKSRECGVPPAASKRLASHHPTRGDYTPRPRISRISLRGSGCIYPPSTPALSGHIDPIALQDVGVLDYRRSVHPDDIVHDQDSPKSSKSFLAASTTSAPSAAVAIEFLAISSHFLTVDLSGFFASTISSRTFSSARLTFWVACP